MTWLVERFSDRLSFVTYSEEPGIGFGLARPEDEPDLDGMVMVPEPLVERLIALAGAYQLHHLPMIDPHGDTRFSHVQRQGVLDELDFIASVLRDPATAEVVAMIRPLVGETRDLDLVVSGN